MSLYQGINNIKIDAINQFLKDSHITFEYYYGRALPQSRSLQRHILEKNKIIYITKGTSTVRYNGKIWHVKQHDIILSTMYSVLETIEHQDLEFKSIFFTLDFEYAQQLFQLLTKQHDYCIYHDQDQQLYPFFNAIEQEFTKKETCYHTLCTTYVIQLIVTLLRKLERLEVPSISEQNLYFTKAIAYMKQNLYQPINIEEVCHALHISKSYLHKIFIQELQCPPGKYLQYVKLEEAKKLLQSKQYTIKEISELLHYSSIYHFSTRFKQYSGSSPKNYLK